jgi:chemotaxis signal transduction protein
MSSDTHVSGDSRAPPSAAASLLALADRLRAAHEESENRVPGEIQQYVTFLLRDEEFAIPILHCREILRAGVITRIPEAPAEVRGVVNLRGRIVPVVDVRTCLGLDQAVVMAKSRLVVVEVAGRLFALLVDRVARILKLASSDLGPAQAPATLPYLAGEVRTQDAAIHIVDIERMLLPGPGTRASTDKE